MELRSGHGRVDGRDHDAVGRELPAGDLREHVERRLRGRVSADAGEQHARRHGADVHDGTAALPAHRRDNRLHCEERRIEVELGDGAQVFEPDLLERHVETLTGVVDEHVHATEVIQGRVHHPDDLPRVPQIGRQRQGIWQFVGQVVDPVGAAGGQQHLGPACRRQPGCGGPDARRGPRHDYDRAVEIHTVMPPGLRKPGRRPLIGAIQLGTEPLRLSLEPRAHEEATVAGTVS